MFYWSANHMPVQPCCLVTADGMHRDIYLGGSLSSVLQQVHWYLLLRDDCMFGII